MSVFRNQKLANNNSNQRIISITLIIIVILGILLRFWAGDTQLTHDELSALSRTHFDSFHDLITQGVFVECHPAGVQILLWLWTRIFGYNEWVVRLPFILMGCACIPLIFSFIKRWSNDNAALWASAAMAFSEYGVLYSTLARPYMAGLFATLCMLYFWSNILQKKHQTQPTKLWLDIAGFSIFAAICAYTQHFAMMTAALTGIWGLFIIEKENRLKYLIGCAVAILLYIPQLIITYYQISQYGGLEWLGKPQFTFIFEYLHYLLEYSWLLIVAILIVICFFFSLKKIKENWKLILFFFTLWLTPLCIGFAYSRWISPVIQFSCLIFSWPFLLLSIGLCFKESGKSIISIAIIAFWSIMLMGNTLFGSLFPYREQIFETSSIQTWKLYDQFGKKDVICWNNCDAEKLEYYENKYNRSLENDIIYDCEIKKLDSILKNSNCHYLITTGVSPYEIEDMQHYFPQILYRKDLHRSSVYVFSKKSDTLYGEVPSFTKKIVSKEILPYHYADEFHPLLDTSLHNFCKDMYAILTAEVQYLADSSAQDYPMLVMETSHNGKLVDWHAVRLDNMPWGGEGKLILNLADIIKWPYRIKNHRIKIYLYNPNHVSGIQPTHFTLKWQEGNAQQYAL